MEEEFPSGLAERIVNAIVKEEQFVWLARESRRNNRVPVPVILPTDDPRVLREERIVDSDVAKLLLKAAECIANAGKTR